MSREARRALDDYSRALRGLPSRRETNIKIATGCLFLALLAVFLLLSIAALIKVVFL